MSTGNATLEYHGSSRAPTLSAGQVSPEVLWDFEEACLNYFNRNKKKIAAEEQTGAILGEMLDFRIRDWISNNRSRLTALDFSAFMKEVRENFLDRDWVEDLHRELTQAHQNKNETFFDYSVRVIKKNAILTHSGVGLEPLRLIQVMEAGMINALSVRAKTAKERLAAAKGDAILQTQGVMSWVNVMKTVDEQQRADIAMFHAITAKQRNDQRDRYPLQDGVHRTNSDAGPRGAKGNSGAGGSSQSGPNTPRLPPLSERERALLRAHEGCFKCRRFYADHTSRNCPTGFPDAATYRPLTEADAQNALRQRSNSAPAALPSRASSSRGRY